MWNALWSLRTRCRAHDNWKSNNKGVLSTKMQFFSSVFPNQETYNVCCLWRARGFEVGHVLNCFPLLRPSPHDNSGWKGGWYIATESSVKKYNNKIKPSCTYYIRENPFFPMKTFFFFLYTIPKIIDVPLYTLKKAK